MPLFKKKAKNRIEAKWQNRDQAPPGLLFVYLQFLSH